MGCRWRVGLEARRKVARTRVIARARTSRSEICEREGGALEGRDGGWRRARGAWVPLYVGVYVWRLGAGAVELTICVYVCVVDVRTQ